MRGIFIGCAAALIACGGRVSPPPSGLQGPTVGDTAQDYPTGEYGFDVGQVIPNFAFTGYAHRDPKTTIDTIAEQLEPIRFGDYWDPDGAQQSTLLVVSVQLVWCGPSNEQEDFTSGANWTGVNTMFEAYAEDYASRGVRFMTLLADGPVVGTAATPSDLKSWVDHHHARSAQALLAEDETGINVLEAAFPYNIIIDTRTMHILDAWIGFDKSSFPEEVEKFL